MYNTLETSPLLSFPVWIIRENFNFTTLQSYVVSDYSLSIIKALVVKEKKEKTCVPSAHQSFCVLFKVEQQIIARHLIITENTSCLLYCASFNLTFKTEQHFKTGNNTTQVKAQHCSSCRLIKKKSQIFLFLISWPVLFVSTTQSLSTSYSKSVRE